MEHGLKRYSEIAMEKCMSKEKNRTTKAQRAQRKASMVPTENGNPCTRSGPGFPMLSQRTFVFFLGVFVPLW